MPTEPLRIDVEDRRSAAVLADALEEQGHPHAAVIRAALLGDEVRARQLIAEHWSQLVGLVPREQACGRWVNGFLSELSFTGRSAPLELASMLASPALRGLRRLGLPWMTDLAPLRGAPSLRELAVFTREKDSLEGWRGLRLDALESLTLDVRTGERLDALATVEMPALRALHTRVAAQQEWAFVRAMAQASWWKRVETWTHRPQSVEGLLALVGSMPLRERGGRGLLALCTAPVLAEVTPQMRASLPHARFEVLPTPEKPRDPEEGHDAAEVTVAPVRAPTYFRELPRRVSKGEVNVQNYDIPSNTSVGSGVPYAELNWWGRLFSGCGWCGSTDTRCIYDQSWSMYSHFETTWFHNWESECPQCGLFTNSGATTIS